MNWRCATKGFVSFLVAVSLVVGLGSCGDRSEARLPAPAGSPQLVGKAGKISEVSPPEVIQTLRQSLEKYQPQVSIVSPRPNEVLQDNTISVQFQVTDLPLFKDAQLGLGPHLHVILDNEPYEAVYSVDQPLVLKDVKPGTHTLRVFSSRPWHESFKNEGAYAQTTFHVFTKTEDNTPSPEMPLLTYSRPKGDYGAEPIMLDFYLTNAPLHLVAQEEDDDDIADWRIRCTINGESFTFDRWQPLYLKGFQPGKNWVQLELLDEKGKPIENAFNNTVRLITYNLNGQDTLSKLVRGEMSAEQARGIVDPNYKPQAITPAPAIAPTPEPEPEVITPSPAIEAPETVKEEPAEEKTTFEPAVEPLPEPAVSPAPTVSPVQPLQPTTPKPGGFFNRFRAPAVPSYTTPKPNFVPRSKPEAQQPEVIEAPEPEVIPEPAEPAIAPAPAPSPEPIESTSTPAPAQEEEQSPPSTVPEAPKAAESKPGGFFNRFRRSTPSPVVPAPSPAPTLPDLLEAPTPEATDAVETTPAATPIESPEPAQEPTKAETPETTKPTGFFHLRPPAPSTTAPKVIEAPVAEPAAPEETTEPIPVEPRVPEPTPEPKEKPKTQPTESKPGSFFNRFRGFTPAPAAPTPTVVPVIPDVIEAPAPEPVAPSTEQEVPASPTTEPTPIPEAAPTPVAPKATTKPGGFFNRFQKPAPSAPALTAPPAIEAPEVEPSVESAEPAIAPSPEPSAAVPEAPEPTLESKYGDIFERLHQATPAPVLPAPIVTPILPEVIAPKPKPALPKPATPALRKRPQPASAPQPVAPKEVPIIQAPEQSDRLQQLREKFTAPSSPAATDTADETEATAGGEDNSEAESAETP